MQVRNHPMLMSTGVRAAARRDPERVAVVHGGRRVSYADLVLRLNRIARYATGLEAGTRVVVLVPNSLEMVELVLGLSEQRVIPVLLSPQTTARELEHVLADAGASVLFCHPDQTEKLSGAVLPPGLSVIATGPEYEALLAAQSPAEIEPTAAEDDLYALHYTSGSTGKPKGVMLAHRCRTLHMLISLGVNQAHYHKPTRSLALAPMFNGAGFVAAAAAIWYGGTLYIHEKFDPEAVLATIAAEKITTGFFVPTHFHAIFNLPAELREKYDVSSLEVIPSGAAALPQATKEQIIAYFGPGRLFEGYGSTETGAITSLRPEDQLARPSCAGRPLTCVEVRVVDDAGIDVPRGETGELLSRSPYLFHGYWNMPELTAEVMRDGWYHTGDLARQDADGYVYIVGRKKNVIISGGQNIYPREVEEVLFQHPEIEEVALVGIPDSYWGEAAHGFVVIRAGAKLDSESLRVWCRQRMTSYKVPKAFHFLPSLPKGASGKVDAKALAARLAEISSNS